MYKFLEGGNWANGAYAGLFSFTDLRAYHEIIPTGTPDVEGLPERWVKILRGETNRIPPIVFKINADCRRQY